MNCWIIWHNVTLNLHTELLVNLNGNEESTAHLAAHMQYTAGPRRNVPDFGRVFLMLKCTDITQNTYVQS